MKLRDKGHYVQNDISHYRHVDMQPISISILSKYFLKAVLENK